MVPQENLSALEITQLKELAREYFITQNLNCGLTMMHCLSDFFHLPVHEQVYASVNGIMEHRDKRYQCGLYKGALMFIGIYGTEHDWNRDRINASTLMVAQAFEESFNSILCKELRLDNFSNPNTCNNLAVDAVLFAAGIIKTL